MANYKLITPTYQAFKILGIKDSLLSLDGGQTIQLRPGMVSPGYRPSIGDFIVQSIAGPPICMSAKDFASSYTLA